MVSATDTAPPEGPGGSHGILRGSPIAQFPATLAAVSLQTAFQKRGWGTEALAWKALGAVQYMTS